jgi:hypothetical protein
MNRIGIAAVIAMAVCPAMDAQQMETNSNQAAATEVADTISGHELGEIVVTAAREQTRIEGDGMVTTVQGTVLQKVGSAKELLGYIPGVLNNNGAIEVLGKGSPMFYINGRPMRDDSELEQLQSAQIKSVKVITNPGARYGSDVSAVIRITTVKNFGDGFALDTKTVGGYRDYLYGSELVKLNYRTDGLDLFSTLNYDYDKSDHRVNSYQHSWTTTPTTSTLAASSTSKQHLMIGQLGFNYQTASGHSFGAYYKAAMRPFRNRRTSESAFTVEGEAPEISTLSNNDKVDYYQHMVDGYYSGNWGQWSADFAVDYLWLTSKMSQLYDETVNGEASVFSLHEKNVGSMLAAELNLSRPVWRGSLSVGGAYSDSRRTDKFANPEGLIDDADNKVAENNVGLYAETEQSFGKLSVQLGLRYEHINNDYFEYGVKVAEQSRTYNEWLPSVNLVLPVGNSVFQLGYSRLSQRPLYGQLSSTVVYSNKYLYETGNPSLKTTYFDILSLNFKYKWLMVMASYKHVTDRIITDAVAYNGNPDITLLMKANSPTAINSFEGFVSISPGAVGQCYYPSLMAGVITQRYELEYCGAPKKMNKPMGIVRFNNIIKLPNDYMLTANLNWRGSGDMDNNHVGASWQLDISGTKTFNRNWDVKLAVTDVFNTARCSSFTILSGVRELSIDKLTTRRAVELTINYHFNVPKSKYKGTGAGKEERQRF